MLLTKRMAQIKNNYSGKWLNDGRNQITFLGTCLSFLQSVRYCRLSLSVSKFHYRAIVYTSLPLCITFTAQSNEPTAWLKCC